MRKRIRKALIIYFAVFFFNIKIGVSYLNSRLNLDKQPVGIVNLVKSDINSLPRVPILTTGIITGRAILGFTLAEVLITLLIIGAVASMVVPSLIADVQDQQYKVAWKKAYSDIDQAVKRLVADNGGNLVNAFTGSNDDFNDKILTYLSYTKKCTNVHSTGNCWHSGQSLHLLNAAPEDFWANDNKPGAVLTNGNLLYIYFRSRDCSHTSAGNLDFGECGQIMVDVNGFKGPNVVGKDVYGLWVKRNGTAAYGAIGDHFYKTEISTCNTSGTGWGCSAQYLYQ